MNPFSDDVPYDFDEYTLQHKSRLDQEFLGSPFSSHSDSTGSLPQFNPNKIQNFLDPEEPVHTTNYLGPLSYIAPVDNVQMNNANFSFQIDHTKRSELTDPSSEMADSIENYQLFDMPEEMESKLNEKSKRIMKREKAKERVKTKVVVTKDSPELLLQNIDSKFIPEGFYNPDLDEKTRKKMIQMVRNRVSAQNSRDKKKMHLQGLEDAQNALVQEKENLARERNELLKKMQKMEQSYQKLIKENEALKQRSLCLKCGCTLEPTQEPEPVRGLRRSHAGGNIFGWGMSFAFLFCLFLMMNSGTVPGYDYKKRTTQLAVATLYNNMGVCPAQAPEEKRPEIIAHAEELEATFEDLQFNGIPIISNIKSLMEKFSSDHEEVYATYANSNKVVDLSDEASEFTISKENFTSRLIAKNENAMETSPVEQIIVANKEKISTLFCPNGFEFFKLDNTKHGDKIEIEDETTFPHTNLPFRTDNVQVKTTLDLEDAKYVQLLLPKTAVGRLGISDYSDDLPPVVQESSGEENTLIEVWAKIYAVAVRDLTLTSL